MNSKGIIAGPIKESNVYIKDTEIMFSVGFFFHFLFVYLPLCPKYHSKYKGVSVSGGGM